MSQNVKTMLRTVTTVMVCLAIVFAFFISAIRIFGVQVYGVLTGSMEPTLPTGSLIYVTKVNPSELRSQDIITFTMGNSNTIATHRIIEVVEENGTTKYRTKGDANASADAALVSSGNVIGKVAFSIPFLGYVASYIQNPPGTYVAIAISILMIAFVFITDSVTSDKNEGKNPAGQAAAGQGGDWLNKLLGKFGKGRQPQQQYQQQVYQQPMQQQYRQQAYQQQQYQQPMQQYQQQAYQQQPMQQQYQQQAYQQPVQQQYQQQVYQQPMQQQYQQQAYQQPVQQQYQQQAYQQPVQQQYQQQAYQQPVQQYPQQGYQQPAQQQYPQQGGYPKQGYTRQPRHSRSGQYNQNNGGGYQG